MLFKQLNNACNVVVVLSILKYKIPRIIMGGVDKICEKQFNEVVTCCVKKLGAIDL
jgi:hypothetical protein